MILLASAKTMKESSVENTTIPVFTDKSNLIRSEISKMSKAELASYFKIKGKTLDNTFKYYSEPCLGKVVTSLDGAVFKQITALNDQYITNNLFVLDALYGILRGTDQINLFRLDFNTKSILDTSYYNYWKDDVNDFIFNSDHKQVLLLTSDEYTKLLNLNQIDKQIFTIEFDSEIKSSVHKKQARGKIANYCIEHQIKAYEQLDKAIIDEYQLILKADNCLQITRNPEENNV